jgi:hypothetical protein
MLTYQAIKHLNNLKEKTEETKEIVNPKSTLVNEASLIEKLELLRHMKTMEIEAQHSFEEWKMFSMHFLQSSLAIYQTTLKLITGTCREIIGIINLPERISFFQSCTL